MWHRLPEHQQRGAQLGNRGARPSADAVAGREVQDHDYADIQTSPTGEPARGIDYPSDPVERRKQDITPDDPHPRVDWDEVVQPERADERQGD